MVKLTCISRQVGCLEKRFSVCTWSMWPAMNDNPIFDDGTFVLFYAAYLLILHLSCLSRACSRYMFNIITRIYVTAWRCRS